MDHEGYEMAICFIHRHHHLDGKPDQFEPHLVCDVCSTAIEDGKGCILWDFDPDTDHNGCRYPMLSACKGVCQRNAERKFREAMGRPPMWMPAQDVIRLLWRNYRGQMSEADQLRDRERPHQ